MTDVGARIRTVALLLAASNGLSRLLGYGRDWLINAQFGATGLTDVYQASFTVPDMLNHLLAGGALTVSFLPRMAQLFEVERKAKENGTLAREADGLGPADRAFSTVFTFMGVLAVVLVVVGEIATEPLVRALVAGFDEPRIQETVRLTRIVMPAQFFFVAGGIVQATLLARQSFAAMALTPLLYNLGILAGGAWGVWSGRIEGFSYGAVAGAAVGAFSVPIWSARHRLRFRPQWRPRDPEIAAFAWTALPLALGVSLTTVDEWFGRYFGSHLEAGAISHLAVARRVMLVPIGLLGTAAGQAAGSFVARLHAEGKREELSEVLARSTAAVVGLSLVLSALVVAAPVPIVGTLFEYGRFHRSDVEAVAGALQPLALGIAFWGAQSVLARALYAVGDTWRPMLAATAITVLAWPIYAVLAQFHIVGLGLAGTLGIAAQSLVLAWIARRRLGLDVASLLRSVARAVIVACVAGTLAWLAERAADRFLPADVPVRMLLRALAAGTAWAVAVVVLGSVLAMPGVPRRLARVQKN
jgi:putative peptidoglycan lipid II flippase